MLANWSEMSRYSAGVNSLLEYEGHEMIPYFYDVTFVFSKDFCRSNNVAQIF